jgi:hypothetical protein
LTKSFDYAEPCIPLISHPQLSLSTVRALLQNDRGHEFEFGTMVRSSGINNTHVVRCAQLVVDKTGPRSIPKILIFDVNTNQMKLVQAHTLTPLPANEQQAINDDDATRMRDFAIQFFAQLREKLSPSSSSSSPTEITFVPPRRSNRKPQKRHLSVDATEGSATSSHTEQKHNRRHKRQSTGPEHKPIRKTKAKLSAELEATREALQRAMRQTALAPSPVEGAPLVPTPTVPFPLLHHPTSPHSHTNSNTHHIYQSGATDELLAYIDHLHHDIEHERQLALIRQQLQHQQHQHGCCNQHHNNE